MSVAVGVSYRWQVTRDMWHVTHDIGHQIPDMWHLTYDTWHMSFFLSFYFCPFLSFAVGSGLSATICTHREIHCLLFRIFFLSLVLDWTKTKNHIIKTNIELMILHTLIYLIHFWIFVFAMNTWWQKNRFLIL